MKHCLVARGGFIEDKFGQAQLADIRKRGVEAAHPEYGTFVAVGPLDDFGEKGMGRREFVRRVGVQSINH